MTVPLITKNYKSNWLSLKKKYLVKATENILMKLHVSAAIRKCNTDTFWLFRQLYEDSQESICGS